MTLVHERNLSRANGVDPDQSTGPFCMAWRIQSLLPPRYVVLLDKACPLICSADFLQSRSATGATMNRDTDSFRTLYDANHRRVRGLLARLVGPEDAEDLAQAVFAKAAKALPTFRLLPQRTVVLAHLARLLRALAAAFQRGTLNPR
jgi:cytochrome P450